MMDAIYIALFCVAVAVVVFLGGMWAVRVWTAFRQRHPGTIPELMVRGLHRVSRWIWALAEGLDSGIIAAREVLRHEPTRPRAEMNRQLWAMRRSRALQAFTPEARDAS